MGNMTDFLVRLFIKDSEDTDNEKVRFRYGLLSSCTGIVCNVLLFLIKLVSGLLMNSVSIVSDGFNNLSDCMSCLITLLGYKLASKPADREHPFGHGRYEYLVSLLVAVMIIVVTFQLFLSSIGKIMHPTPVHFDAVLFALLTASILVKVWMSAFNTQLGKKLNNMVMLTTAQDSRNDVFVTALSLVAMILSTVNRSIPFDGIFGIALAGILFYSGYSMIRDIVDRLLGAPADSSLTKKIRDEILSYPEIIGVHDMIIHEYGPGCHIGSAHAEVNANTEFMHAHDVIDCCERAIQDKYHVMMTLHMDPVDYSNPKVNAYRAEVTETLRQLDAGLSMHDFRIVAGTSHTNLVFDILMPYSCTISEDEIRETIETKMAELHPETKLYTVITFDRSYVED